MLDKIKRYYFEQSLKDNKLVKKKGINPAKNIAVIMQDMGDGQVDAVKRYISQLKKRNKEVSVIFYKSHKLKKTDERTADYFYKSDVNWYGIPSHDILDSFLQKEYDILLYLDDTSELPMEYLLRMTKSQLKISPYSKGIEKFTDFSIDCKNHDKAGQLDEIDKLLDKLSNG